MEAAPTVFETFNGEGTLNKYFKEILYRQDKKSLPLTAHLCHWGRH